MGAAARRRDPFARFFSRAVLLERGLPKLLLSRGTPIAGYDEQQRLGDSVSTGRFNKGFPGRCRVAMESNLFAADADHFFYISWARISLVLNTPAAGRLDRDRPEIFIIEFA